MKEGLKRLKDSFLHLVYPTTCLHCSLLLAPSKELLCSSCASLLQLIDPKERCLACFNLKEHEQERCRSCIDHPLLFYRLAAAFDYEGPASSLIKHLKYYNQPYLARGLAAFLAAQFVNLDWPFPDALIPVPISWTHHFDRGYNQSALLARELAAFLKVPVWDVLKRRSGDYSQAGLNLTQRQSLNGERFTVKADHALEDKTLLLIDDVLTSGQTLNRCAEILLEYYPASLYGLTVCRSML